MVHTWLSVDDHLLPGMRCLVAAAVGHVLAGSKLQHLHEAQRHAPLQKELLVEWSVSVAAATAVLTSGRDGKKILFILCICIDYVYVTKWQWLTVSASCLWGLYASAAPCEKKEKECNKWQLGKAGKREQ